MPFNEVVEDAFEALLFALPARWEELSGMILLLQHGLERDAGAGILN
jgi:hypothetical protein